MSQHHDVSAESLERRLKEVERDLAIAEKDRPEHVHALTAEKKKLEAQLAQR
ncbi:hypothetical protein [Acetobacter estunensis]|uniref:hypothetical protein n=1 Tax=Acetobacter estunensis TaxID=104097 RepID=UPI00140DB582|nr:hypothetical protein [Acetobacter estunensis]MBV1837362.1 hypothetical protein [Acetobacter estunensis]